jgi:hypothetical protein
MLRRSSELRALVLCVPFLLWPALYNGYPLVFADTGTYLAQAIERHAGWDRPVFYSLFLLPLHAGRSTWPAIVAQALLCAYVVRLAQRVLLPGASPYWLVGIMAGAGIATALPWFAAQLMPDLFTPLLVLVLAVLLFAPERPGRVERAWLVLLGTFLVATQQSSVLLYPLLALPLAALRRRLGAARPLGCGGMARIAAPWLLAVSALLAVNLAAFGRVSVSPYGNVFLLARTIYDGPGLRALQRACPRAGWRLCAWRDRLPASSDAFLWDADSPARRIGGHAALAAEADAIIRTALRAEPGAEALAALRNAGRQLRMFATGDGLHRWPATVDPVIAKHFPPAEQAAYAAARQQHTGASPAGAGNGWDSDAPGAPGPYGWMQALHRIAAISGIGGCLGVLALGIRRRRHAAGFAAAALLVLLANAAIAGSLSAPHHRYQSRVMLLPPLIAVLGAAALRRDGSGCPQELTVDPSPGPAPAMGGGGSFR